MPLREYAGAAKRTTLSADITAVSTSISGADFTNWPTGVPGNFFIIIDRGLSNEEKILCSSRSGNTLTVAGSGRGADSTSAAAHTSGAFVEHGLTATDISEVNDHTFDVTNDDHTQYLNNARHDVEARHTFGAAFGTAQAGADVTVGAGIAGAGANPANEAHTHKGTGTLASGYAQVTAAQSGITTDTDLTGLIVTVTVAAGRRIRITGSGDSTRTVADGTTEIYIKQDGTQVGRTGNQPNVINEANGFKVQAVLTPTTGSHTYKLSMARATGTGTVTLSAGATFPAFILVEDVGV